MKKTSDKQPKPQKRSSTSSKQVKPIAYFVSSSGSHKKTRVESEAVALDLAKRCLEVEMMKGKYTGPGENPYSRQIRIEIEPIFRGIKTIDEECEERYQEQVRKAEAKAKEKTEADKTNHDADVAEHDGISAESEAAPCK